jgi:uncharacterized protein (TIGR00730 family)
MGTSSTYQAEAKELGHLIAKAGLSLVYGAGSIGLMGVVARSAQESGADVIGIIPGHLDDIEITQNGLTELHVTDDMHQRKKMMFEKSDAFIVLPGGFGTLDETLEMMTWSQLGLHKKPIILVNSDGYWSPLMELVDHVVTGGFAAPENADLLTVVTSPTDALAALI